MIIFKCNIIITFSLIQNNHNFLLNKKNSWNLTVIGQFHISSFKFNEYNTYKTKECNLMAADIMIVG